ncbi:MAG: FtsW/RodA/SpoVE family cell cycle protein [Prevotellaceae bacterium]|jgi:cell division protein FtsW|nr:FtsW/RodA/SpoVE family cell cycle protein [Prevotellaceae bacterium]
MNRDTIDTRSTSLRASALRALDAIRRSAFMRSFRGDRVLWQIIIILLAISLLAIFSSTSALAELKGSTAFAYLKGRFGYIIITILLIYVVHSMPYYLYRNFSKMMLVVSVALLVYTLFAGERFNEASRSINVFGVFSFHPSELAKYAILLYVAKVLEEGAQRNIIDTFRKYLWRIIVPVALLCVLLILTGSTFAALLTGFTVFVVLVIARVRTAYLLKTLAIAIPGLGLIVLLSYTTPAFGRVKKMIDNRVLVFYAPQAVEKNVEALTFQPTNARIAVASGGLFGKGPGNSTQRHILPNAYDDFIFAIIVEEYGLAGGLFVMFLYFWMLYRAVVIARGCRKIFYSAVAVGLVLQIVFQALLHMSVTTGIGPVTGQTLPLISHGGSSLFMTGFALGIVLAISREADEQEKRENAGGTAPLEPLEPEDQ